MPAAQRVVEFVKPLGLSVFMSNKYIYAQVIFAPAAHTVAQASSLERSLRESLPSTSDKRAAALVGETLAQRMLEKDISAVAFQMAPHQRYHGKLKALLDSLRENGVKLV